MLRYYNRLQLVLLFGALPAVSVADGSGDIAPTGFENDMNFEMPAPPWTGGFSQVPYYGSQIPSLAVYPQWGLSVPVTDEKNESIKANFLPWEGSFSDPTEWIRTQDQLYLLPVNLLSYPQQGSSFPIPVAVDLGSISPFPWRDNELNIEGILAQDPYILPINTMSIQSIWAGSPLENPVAALLVWQESPSQQPKAALAISDSRDHCREPGELNAPRNPDATYEGGNLHIPVMHAVKEGQWYRMDMVLESLPNMPVVFRAYNFTVNNDRRCPSSEFNSESGLLTLREVEIKSPNAPSVYYKVIMKKVYPTSWQSYFYLDLLNKEHLVHLP